MGTRLWNPIARAVTFAAVFALGSLLIASIEPFGVDEAMDRHSRDLLYRAFASHYGSGVTDPGEFELHAIDPDDGSVPLIEVWKPPADRAGVSTRPDDRSPVNAQNEVVMVYLSEIVLDAMRRQFGTPDEEDTASPGSWQNWRPSYAEHAQLVFELATLHEAYANAPADAAVAPPPAIFLDFIFLQDGGTREERENFDSFVEIIGSFTKADEWSPSRFPAGSNAQIEAQKRCGTPVRKVACIKEAGGIPLIFAEAVPLSASESLGPAQQRLLDVAVLAPVRFVKPQGIYPLATTSVSSSERDIFKALDLGSSRQLRKRATPASLLYLAWCMDNENACPWLEPEPGMTSRQARMAEAFEQFLAKDPRDISVIWGSTVPDYFADLEYFVYGQRPQLAKLDVWAGTNAAMRKALEVSGEPLDEMNRAGRTVCIADAEWYALLTRLLFNKVPSEEASSVLSLRQPCPYHVEVPYFPIGTGAVTPSMAHALFDGRVIIVGSRFRNSSDNVQSVVHGVLPGMHQHAMAFDNLLTNHKLYMSSPYQDHVLALFGLGRIDENDLHETLTMFLIALVAIMGQFTLNRRLMERARSIETGDKLPRRPSHWLLYIMTLLTIVLVVGGALAAQVFILRAAPMNWLGMIVLAWSFFIFLMRDEIGDDISKLFRRTPGIKQAGKPVLDWVVRFRRYLDMETIGFERDHSVLTARSAKDRVVETVYPDTEHAAMRPDHDRDQESRSAPGERAETVSHHAMKTEEVIQ